MHRKAYGNVDFLKCDIYRKDPISSLIKYSLAHFSEQNDGTSFGIMSSNGLIESLTGQPQFAQ